MGQVRARTCAFRRVRGNRHGGCARKADGTVDGIDLVVQAGNADAHGIQAVAHRHSPALHQGYSSLCPSADPIMHPVCPVGWPMQPIMACTGTPRPRRRRCRPGDERRPPPRGLHAGPQGVPRPRGQLSVMGRGTCWKAPEGSICDGCGLAHSRPETGWRRLTPPDEWVDNGPLGSWTMGARLPLDPRSGSGPTTGRWPAPRCPGPGCPVSSLAAGCQGCGTTASSASIRRSTSSVSWKRWVEILSGEEKVPGAAFWLESPRREWGTELLRITIL